MAELNDSEQNQDESVEEETPAGSYRLPGQDVSAYLGVDSEYMNAANPGDEARLSEAERYLFLPADYDELDGDVEDGDEVTDPDQVGEVVQGVTLQRPPLG